MANETRRGRFVWHELMTADPAAAQKFYTTVAGWGTQAFDGLAEPYTMWTANGASVGGVMQLPPDAAAPTHWLGYISAPDTDATAAEARAKGATIMVPPTDIPDVGRFAVLTDPFGAAFAIFTPGAGGSGPSDAPKTGEFSWHELTTTDVDAAFAFYQSLFGWEKTSAMDMGDMGVYQMFGFDGVPFGGMFRKPADMPGPPSWQHYIKVDDVKRVVETIKSQGGQVVNGPMEVPGGDWIANGIDPQGGMFSVHSTA
jgi:uncharacterized protein